MLVKPKNSPVRRPTDESISFLLNGSFIMKELITSVGTGN